MGDVRAERAGTASWSGGFVGTARDMARFGLMMLRNGLANNKQLVPTEVVEDIRNLERRR